MKFKNPNQILVTNQIIINLDKIIRTTMFFYRNLLIIFLLSIGHFGNTQIVIIKNGVVSCESGSVFFCNGGIEIMNNSQFINDGTVTVTKNSSIPQNGNFLINSNSTVSGNGLYEIEQDWVNDAQFNCGSSTVELFGNTQQLVQSNSNTVSTFNNLTLTGNGAGNDRKKTLVNCNIFISNNGILDLNDRELETQINTVTVNNNAVNAVINSLVFGQEGFVSSTAPGSLIRSTNSNSNYTFPVGSSDNVLRYRPIIITPSASNLNEFGVRMNNYDSNLDGYNRTVNDGTISNANSFYYHSITQPMGNDNAEVSILYYSMDDGVWSDMANWQNSWISLSNSNLNSSPNYSDVTVSNRSVKNNPSPYILVNLEEQFEVPNIFTPNNDGENDFFISNAKNVTDYNFIIVNRWGQVVFESNDINASWDGKYNDNLCTEGTYFYVLTGYGSNTKAIKKQGFLQLEY